MFKFLSSTYWQPKASDTLMSDVMQVMDAIPDLIGAESVDHESTAASRAGEVAAQALSTTADFAMKATGSLLGMAWSGLVNYGPPLAQGVWNGITTYGPPLAQGAWNGLKTYGPPTAIALGKATAWVGANAWEAAKWGGKALAAAAEEHHVKERAIALGEELLVDAAKGLVTLALAGLDPLSGKAAEPGVKNAVPPAASGLDPVADGVLPVAQMSASAHLAQPDDTAELWPDSHDMQPELSDCSDGMAVEHGPVAGGERAAEDAAHGKCSPDFEFGHDKALYQIDIHVHVCLTGTL